MGKTADGHFQPLVDRYTSDFTGREWLQLQLDSLLQEPNCRMVVITGEPGIGKTAFLAHLASRNGDWLRYFIRQDSRQLLQPADATTFLLTIGSQLATIRPQLFSTVPDIRARQNVDTVEEGSEAVAARIGEFLSSPFAKTALDIEQTVEHLKGRATAIEIGRWVMEARTFSLQDLQSMALLRPADILSKLDPTARLVVIVDALDESRFSPTNTGILRALCEMPEMPPNLTFIVGSRPDPSLEPLLARSDTRELALDLYTNENKNDVRSFISDTMENAVFRATLSQNNVRPEEFIDALLVRSGGNFLYARSVLNAVNEAASDVTKHDRLPGLLDATTLPSNLAELYNYFLKSIAVWCQREFPSQTWSMHLGPMLGALAIAREPLNDSQLASFTQQTLSQVRLLLHETRQFIDIIEDNSRGESLYRIFHRSFTEYLTDGTVNRGYLIDIEDSHFKTAHYYLEMWGGLESQLSGIPSLLASSEVNREVNYGLRHLPAHLYQAQKPELASSVLCSLAFIAAKIQAGMMFALLEDYADILTGFHIIGNRSIGNRSIGNRELLQELDYAISRAAEWLLRHPESLHHYLFTEMHRDEPSAGIVGPFAINFILPTMESSGLPWLEPVRWERTDFTIEVPKGPVDRWRRSVAVLSNGTVAIGCHEGVVQLWKQRQQLREMVIADNSPVEAVAESAPGSIVVVVWHHYKEGLVLAIDLESSKTRQICSFAMGPEDPVKAIQPLSDNRLAILTYTGNYRIVDQDSGKLVFSATCAQQFTCASIEANGNVVFTTKPQGTLSDCGENGGRGATRYLSEPRRIWRWNPEGDDIQILGEYNPPPQAMRQIVRHPEDIVSVFVDSFTAVAVKPDGTFVLAAHDKCYILDPQSRQVQHVFQHSSSIEQIAIGPDHLIALCGQDTALIIQPLTVSRKSRDANQLGVVKELRTMAPLPDGKALTFGGLSNDVNCFDPVTGNIRHLTSIRRLRNFTTDSAAALSNGIITLASNLDGWALAVDPAQHIEIIGRLRTNKVSSRLGNMASFLCWEDGQNQIKNWNSTTGKIEVFHLGDVGKRDHIKAFVPIGEHQFALGSGNGTVWLWNARTKEETVLATSGFMVTGLGIGPNDLLIGCFEDGTLTLWDLNEIGNSISIFLRGRPIALSCADTSLYISVGLAHGEIAALRLHSASDKQLAVQSKRWRIPSYTPLFMRSEWSQMKKNPLGYFWLPLLIVIMGFLTSKDKEWDLISLLSNLILLLSLCGVIFLLNWSFGYIYVALASWRLRRRLEQN